MREKEVEKKGGKEDESPTMPLMLFNFYRVIRSWRKGRDFFARLEYKQDGIPSCRGCGHRKIVRVVEQKTSNGKGMYEEYKRTKRNDERDEIRSDTRV